MTDIIEHIETSKDTREKLVLIKPTIEEIISVYNQALEKSLDAGVYHYQPWNDIIEQNTKYLSCMDVKDYNQKHFDMLIASILLNGKKHFNMSMFMGMVPDLEKHLYDAELQDRAYGNSDTVHGLHNDYLDPLMKDYTPFLKTTKAFNCDTIGCIAGFAVANAVNWRDDLVRDSRGNYFHSHNQKDLFEQIACNFLNIPVSVGTKMFYGDSDSFWAMVYGELEYFEDDEGIDVFKGLAVNPYEDCVRGNYQDIDLSSINHEMAAVLLEFVKCGYFQVDSKNRPYISVDYKYKQIQELENE